MALVRLAGGIVWREAPEGARVALIHRPREGDWSLPKGRIGEGETWEEAAVREVEEETACEARITSFAGAAIYVPRRVPRLVLYWNMALQREGRFEAGREVDELLWVAPGGAVERLGQEGGGRRGRGGAARAAPGGALAAPVGAPGGRAGGRAGTAAAVGLGVCFRSMPRASRQGALWAAVCGSLAGAAVALLLSWRSDPG